MDIGPDSAYSIRQFTLGDVEVYKAMRLEALELEFGMFGNSHLTEAAFPDTYWKDRLVNPDIACFGLFQGNDLIGITSVVVDSGNRDEAYMTQSYIRKAFRGMGLSGLLYRARFDWARQKKIRKLTIGHKRTNNPSGEAIRHHGFLFTHSISRHWPDGSVEDMVYYELLL